LNDKKLAKSVKLEIELMTENEQLESFFKNLDFGTGGIRAKMGLGSNLLNVYSIARITLRHF